MSSHRSAVDFACVAVPKVFGGVCLVLLNVGLLSRLGPESFGVYSLCLAAIGLCSEGLFGAAIDLGVLRLAPLYVESDPKRAIRIERAGLILKVQAIGGLTAILIVGAMAIRPSLFQGFGSVYLIAISCAAALGVLMFSSGLLHLQIRGQFLLYGLLDSVHLLLKFGGVGGVLYVLHDARGPLGPERVLLWFALGPLVAFALFFWFFRKPFFFDSPSHDRSSAELIGHVKWILFTLLLTSLVARLDMFCLTTLASIEEVGIFAGGQTIASIPLLIGSYLGIVFSPKVMPYWRAGTFYRLLRNVQAGLYAIGIMICGIAFWYRDSLTAYILPESFKSSAEIILILLPATIAGMTSFPLAVPFMMFVWPRFLVRLECLLFPFLIVGYLVLISQYGAWGAAVVTAGYGLLKTVIVQSVAFYWARISPEEAGLAFDS